MSMEDNEIKFGQFGSENLLLLIILTCVLIIISRNWVMISAGVFLQTYQ